MVEIRRILCPVDFSEASRHALAHAVSVARWYDAAVTALHVVHPVFRLQPPILFAEMSASVEVAGAERLAIEETLQTWLEPARQAGLATDLVVETGNPVPVILARARAIEADLVVMGTHGLSGFEPFMLGSVADRVLCKAPCPVMTVPLPVAAEAHVPYLRILCPIDFSDSSLAALRFAVSIAEESDAHLTLLHVLEGAEDDGNTGRGRGGKLRDVAEAEAHARLDALITAEERVWCKPSTKIACGKAYRQILAAAERERTDLIVIGARGPRPLDLAFFGSTTNHVVRRASCPVLTLRE